MKKLSIAILTLVSALFMFSSCSDDDAKNLQLTGYWQCTGISGTIGGKEIAGLTSANCTYLKLMSIGFVGASTGVYARVGQVSEGADLSGIASQVSSLTSNLSTTDSQKSAWTSFISKGGYQCVNGTMTLNRMENGAVSGSESYVYSLDGNTLKLTQEIADASSANATVGSVITALNTIFTAAGTSTINTTANLTYTYTKVDIATLTSLFSSTSAE